MNRLHAHSVGLALGIFVGFWHTIWAVLVWSGGAQWCMDFVFKLHMITPVYQIAPFSLGNAVALILLTACSGYIFGCAIGVIWNYCGPQAAGT